MIVGLDRSAIGTLVERSSRFTMLVHLPREAGYGLTNRTKNGPALGGYAAITMANALKKTVMKMPTQLWRSLTWDRGKDGYASGCLIGVVKFNFGTNSHK